MPPALLSESGHFSPRRGRYRETAFLCIRYLLSVTETTHPLWRWLDSGSGMVWEASIRTCIYFFILCCPESYSRLRAVSILWLFSGWMWWHRIARSVSSKCPSTLCVYAWQDAFTFFVNLTNRRSVWAAKHVTNYRKWGWMGIRSPSLFLFPNFMRNQLELGHSHLP